MLLCKYLIFRLQQIGGFWLFASFPAFLGNSASGSLLELATKAIQLLRLAWLIKDLYCIHYTKPLKLIDGCPPKRGCKNLLTSSGI